MSSVDRQSVREEAERIKMEFDRLATRNKMNSEAKAIVQSMLMRKSSIVKIAIQPLKLSFPQICQVRCNMEMD